MKRKLNTIYLIFALITLANGMDRQWYTHSDGNSPHSEDTNSSQILNAQQNSYNNQTLLYYSKDLSEHLKNQNNKTADELSQEVKVKYSGRSAKSLDIDEDDAEDYKFRSREPRIINDAKSPNLSIKGFIPIVGFGNDKHDNSPTHEKPEENSEIQSYSNQPYYHDNQNSYSHQPNPQQHIARPEDQRFIGAAFQNMAESLSGKPSRKYGYSNENYNYGVDSLGSSLEDCVCVPFYMCKNGYLRDAPKNALLKPNNLEAAQSIINQFAIPLRRSQLSQQHKPQNTNPMEYLPLDERSNDDLTNAFNTQNFLPSINDSTPQYADEVLTRMLGMSRSYRAEGCGLLRTCCRVYPDYQQNIYQNPTNIQSGLIHVQKPSQFNKRLHNPYQPFIQQIPSYDKPEEEYPTQIVQSSYNIQRPFNPNHGFGGLPSRPIVPQLPPPIKNEYFPHKPAPVYPGLKPSIPHSIDDAPPHFGHGTCGLRHSVGVHGRVQNLNYHESSTEFGEYPWQVAILKRLGPADSLYVCGGTLISPIFVATAAHCIKKFTSHDLKVRVGEWDVHRDDEFYPYVEKYIHEIIIHPQFFAGNLVNDIALIRIESPIDFTQNPHIAPACLPEIHDNFAGHRCLVSGWGKNVFGHQGEFQSVLKEVDVPVLNHRACEHALKQTRLGPYYQLHPSMLCAGGEPGKDACEGDGGSPMVCEARGVWKVVGLVSWGLGCGQHGVPGVYTNIANLRPWIDSIVLRAGFGSHGYGGPNDSLLNFISERSNSNNANITENREIESNHQSNYNLITTESSV